MGLHFQNEIKNKENYVVPVIGDGSLVEGIAFEGLNYVSVHNTKLVIILNDNGIAIAPNVGGINKITSDKDYIHLCKNFFEGFGIKYFCVENGHSISNLVDAYELAKNCSSPSIVHVKTIKGNGLNFAAEHPYKNAFFNALQSE